MGRTDHGEAATILAVAVAMCACGRSGAGTDAAVGDPGTPDETASIDPRGSNDTATGPDDAGAPDRPDAGDASSQAEASDPGPAEVAPEVFDKPIPPEVPGPPTHLWDCTYDPATLPGHVSPVPLGCVLDPGCHQAMVVGHRGTGGDFGTIAPENSLAAIRAAIVMGVDGVELDVRETKDDRLVLMHDGSVDRTTDGTGDVDQMTFDEVHRLHLKTDKLKSGADCSCETVPALEDALALAKGRVFVTLDTKTDRVDLVVAAIQAAGVRDQVLVSVGSFDKAVEARAIDPAIHIWVRPDTMDEVQQATDLFDPDPEVYEIPPELAAQAGPVVHALGRKTSADVWSADMQYYLDENPSDYIGPFQAGLDCQMTEFPTQMLQALGRWPF